MKGLGALGPWVLLHEAQIGDDDAGGTAGSEAVFGVNVPNGVLVQTIVYRGIGHYGEEPAGVAMCFIPNVRCSEVEGVVSIDVSDDGGK